MAYIINLEIHTDIRGNLTIIENVIPFMIKRVFHIYGVDISEGDRHWHHKTNQAAVYIQGQCKIYNTNGKKKMYFI